MRLVKLTSLLLILGPDPVNAPDVATMDEFKAKASELILGGKPCASSDIKSAVRQFEALCIQSNDLSL